MAEVLIEIVVAPIVENLISQIASSIKEEVGLLRGLETEVEKLSSKLTSIQAALKDAEERQHENRSLRDWLGKLKNAVLDAEDILETLATKAALSKRKKQVHNICYQRDAAHKIKKLLERLDEISEEKEKFHLKNDSDGRSILEQPQTSDRVDTVDVCGREIDKENLMKLLLSDEEEEMSIIPIIGMAGLGKTTLAQLLFNDDQIKNRFERRMWVSVSINFDLAKIIRDIIEYHSNMRYPTDLSLNQLESRLLHILDGNPFLLVLDNVWNEDYMKWEPLLKILKRGDKKSKIIVTSRSTEVAKIMGTRPPYFPEFLPEDKCWSLFEKIAFNHTNDSKRSHLEAIGREIVRKCKGLPLAVKAMAGLLRGEDGDDKWENILSSHVWELEDKELHTKTPKIMWFLKLSYDHLRPLLKQCFAYCSIFPKAYFFHKEELVKFWIAQGFFHSKEIEKQEKIGNGCFDELLVRSFFQLTDTEKKRYQMHDLMHDLAHLISGPHCCQVMDSKSCTCSAFKETRHVSLLCENIEQPVLSIVENSQKLRTFQFSGEYLRNFGEQILEKIFHTLKYLRTLDLSNSTLSELPSSVENLKLLRYLDLSRTEISVLPNSICNLYNLQTLKLLGCLWFSKLPEDFSNLVNLRNLELDDIFWFKSSTLPPRLGNLTRLRDLHAFQVGCRSGYGIEELKNMVYLTGTMHISKLENTMHARDAKLNEKENLAKLVLEWSSTDINPPDVSDDERLLEYLKPHSNIKELCIFNYKGNSFPNWIAGELQNLRTLTLKGCTKCKVLSLGHTPHLRELHIKGMRELEKWSDKTCTSLSILKISCCEKLNELPAYFLSLRVMKIKRCCSLKSLPVTPYLMFLLLVDNPVLEDLNERQVQIVIRSDGGHDSTRHQPSFSQLLEMKISKCPRLQALPNLFAPQKLEISECESLNTQNLITMREHRLQHLALDKCRDETLVRAIHDTSSLYSLVISNISNLTTFPRWPNLPSLRALYMTCCSDLVSLSGEGSLISLSSLELLSIRECSKLENLPDEGLPTALKCLIIASCSSLKSLGPNGTLRSLNSLTDLYIENCPLLLFLPEDGLPTSLQHLHIRDCPSLTKQCGTADTEGPEWPKISHIPDREIDYIKSPHPSNNIPPSAAWHLPFCCRAGFDISDSRQLKQQRDAQSSTARRKGELRLKWKGKTERGESSTSTSVQRSVVEMTSGSVEEAAKN